MNWGNFPSYHKHSKGSAKMQQLGKQKNQATKMDMMKFKFVMQLFMLNSAQSFEQKTLHLFGVLMGSNTSNLDS